jgi:hypothetical protein
MKHIGILISTAECATEAAPFYVALELAYAQAYGIPMLSLAFLRSFTVQQVTIL